MKTVQVAIQDSGYADSIRNLLSRDGSHLVHLVREPDPTVAGVILVDSARLDCTPLLLQEHRRLIVMARKDCRDLAKIWDAGVRHVVFEGDSPDMTRVVVLGVELGLSWALSAQALPQ